VSVKHQKYIEIEGNMEVVGTILGVILGGLITWGIGSEQRKHDLNKEKRELLLSKYEELHNLLGKLQGCVNDMVIQIVSEAALDSKFDPKAIKNQMPLEQVTMLIEFYVPELKDDHEYIKRQTTFLYEHVCKHIMEVNKTKQFLTESAVTAHELSKATTKTVSSMKTKLATNASGLLENA
jgi:hypothetical protein